MAAGMVLFGSACEELSSDGGGISNAGLPRNPSVPASRDNSSAQDWYFHYKSSDNTFRIRWPTYFYTEYDIGPGSYTLVDGEVAEFRSYDTDRGGHRPSYTIPGPRTRFEGEVLCVLVAPSGERLAWFVAPAEGRSAGRLP